MDAVARIVRSLEERGLQVQAQGDGFRATCPVCNEPKALSLREGERRALLRCFRYGGGCGYDQILRELGLAPADLYREEARGEGGSVPSRNRATAQPSGRGLSLEEYAERKSLFLDSLRALGLSTITLNGSPAVRIPYFDAGGEERACQLRFAMQGDLRFRWRKGTKAMPYGLWKLEEAREQSRVFLVEGASDCHTLWHHGLPALGVPGAETLKPEHGPLFEGIESVLLIVEPDHGGERLIERCRAAGLEGRVRLVRLDGYKDASDLHTRNPDGFMAVLDAAVEQAEPLAALVEAELAAERAQAWEDCQVLAHTTDILGALWDDLQRRGVVGEERAVKLLYLVFTSRLLARPLSAVVKGPSSSGKSFSVEKVCEYFPEGAYYALSAMSERALVYDDEPLAHRILVLYEAAGCEGEMITYLLRSILSEGRVDYVTVEKGADGAMQKRHITREGPTGFVTTTTKLSLHPENETRMLSIPVTDTREQTARVLMALAEEEERPPVAAAWPALQTWLAGGELRVALPFGKDLMGAIPALAVRLRRDGRSLLTLLKCHALLHRASRERDDQGRVVATLEDYEAVRGLVADLISAGLEASVPPDVRETVAAVAQVLKRKGEANHYPGAEEVTVSGQELARELNVDKSAASRRARKATQGGYLRNEEPRPGRPMKLVLGEPMPDDQEVLPTVERLRGCAVAAGVNSPPLLSEEDEAWEAVA